MLVLDCLHLRFALRVEGGLGEKVHLTILVQILPIATDSLCFLTAVQDLY